MSEERIVTDRLGAALANLHRPARIEFEHSHLTEEGMCFAVVLVEPRPENPRYYNIRVVDRDLLAAFATVAMLIEARFK